MQSQQHLCGGRDAFTQWAVDQKRLGKKTFEWKCYKSLDVTCFYYYFFSYRFLFSFSMWFELLACRLLWVINTNEGVLFIFEILFWDVQAPCYRCLFIFIINNKSKDSLLFNPGLHSVWINKDAAALHSVSEMSQLASLHTQMVQLSNLWSNLCTLMHKNFPF